MLDRSRRKEASLVDPRHALAREVVSMRRLLRDAVQVYASEDSPIGLLEASAAKIYALAEEIEESEDPGASAIGLAASRRSALRSHSADLVERVAEIYRQPDPLEQARLAGILLRELQGERWARRDPEPILRIGPTRNRPLPLTIRESSGSKQ